MTFAIQLLYLHHILSLQFDTVRRSETNGDRNTTSQPTN